MAVNESNQVDWNTARGKLVWAGMIAAMTLSSSLAVMGLYALITGTVVVFPESWGAMASGLALAGSVIVGGGITAAMVRMTPPATRQRYAAMVCVTTVACIVVVVGINLGAGVWNYDHNFETLGRYGLSDRTRAVVTEVRQPVRLSAVYTGAYAEASDDETRRLRDRTQRRLGRVLELFDEIQRANPTIETVDASSDAARALMMTRLRDRQQAHTGDYQKLLKEMLAALPAAETALTAEANRWSALPPNAYLNLWNMGPQRSAELTKAVSILQQTQREIQRELATNPLPDHVKLTEALTKRLNQFNALFSQVYAILQPYDDLPRAVLTRTVEAMASVDAAIIALDAAAATAGATGTPEAVLQSLSPKLRGVARALRDAQTHLLGLGGADLAPLIERSRAFQVQASRGSGTTVSTMSSEYKRLADSVVRLRSQVNLAITDAKPAAQKRILADVHALLAQQAKLLRSTKDPIAQGIRLMGDVDPDSQAILDDVRKKRLFGTTVGLLRPLLIRAGNLTPPLATALPPALSEPNILVLEAGERITIISFAEAWPALQGKSAEDDGETRFFNADAAIAARLLRLTQPAAFGRVLLVFYRQSGAKELGALAQRLESPIPPRALRTLQRRLTEANLVVQTWDLAGPMPPLPPNTDPGLPTTLLVLPPPATVVDPRSKEVLLSSIQKKHVQKIQRAIDQGASAIFAGTMLPNIPTGFGFALPHGYRFNDYLRHDWGLQLDTNYMLLTGHLGEKLDQFNVTPFLLQYMPLNGFADHPIGRPLRGRRLLWPRVCPVTVVDESSPPAGVHWQPLLDIPASQTQFWATKHLDRMAKQANENNGWLTPSVAQGDMRAPLLLAVAATRDATDKRPAARIVVMGMASGLTDAYLSNPVILMREKGGYKPTPPPGDNPDLIVNSVYWLIGREGNIAAGPVMARPVEALTATQQNLIWTLTVVALPVAILLIGAVVMLLRKRS